MDQVLRHMNWESCYSEIMTHLGNLIRINTVNPPGNELAAAQYIAEQFEQAGIPATILESAPGRANLIARIKGDGSRKPLLLMSHLDVVGVEPDQWTYEPFSATVAEGFMWGRGALDCKNTVALWMMVLLILHREKVQLKRDLIFLAAADEESGGEYGAKWLVKHHYDLIEAEAALNEGGGFGMQFLGKTFYTYQTAEKGNIWLRFTASGTAGHASMPKVDNPVLQITDLLYRLGKFKPGFCVIETVREMIMAMASTQALPVNLAMRQLLNRYLSEHIISLAIKNTTTASSFRAMLNNTICPTVLKAGHKVNVIPSQASAEVDVRVLPGEDQAQMLARIRRMAGDNIRLEILDQVPPTESPLDHPLADSIKRAVLAQQPEAALVPLLLPGSTDGAFFRAKGVVVYGFTPVLPLDDMDLAHGHDERISLESVRFSLQVGLKAVLDFVG